MTDMVRAAELALISNDLGALGPEERLAYMRKICESVGINHLTQPFQYIRLNGKLTLYATKGCTDQLRAIKGVSIEIVENTVQDDQIYVHVRATVPDERHPSGLRTDEDIGVVKMRGGENGINDRMKAITKAKRRITLSICGLGMLDESEIETIPKERVERIEAPPEVKAVLMPPKKEKKTKKEPKPAKARTAAANKKEFAKAVSSFEKAEVAEEKVLKFLKIKGGSEFTEKLQADLRIAFKLVARGQYPKGLEPDTVTCFAEVPAPPGDDMAGVE